jgi:hypothetical protein
MQLAVLLSVAGFFILLVLLGYQTLEQGARRYRAAKRALLLAV